MDVACAAARPTSCRGPLLSHRLASLPRPRCSRPAARRLLRCHASAASIHPAPVPPTCGDRVPVIHSATAFAPATVANLGPGFDFMGCAVEGAGDTVTARVLTAAEMPADGGRVVIDRIDGDGGRLTLVAGENCVGIAAEAALGLLHARPDVGVGLTLHKGLPLGSGLGSSAASAAAAAWAVNVLFGTPLTRAALVPAGLVAEAAVSGYHADNVAPALMGGFVLVRSYHPRLVLQPLPFGGLVLPGCGGDTGTSADGGPWFALVTPLFEAPTKAMRAALPESVPFRSSLANCSAAAQLVLGIVAGDAAMLGTALGADTIVEAARAPLIPGMSAVKAAAAAAGAHGCTISGAGPTAVAIVPTADVGRAVATAMAAAFLHHGGLTTARAVVARLCVDGARVVTPGEDPLRHELVITVA